MKHLLIQSVKNNRWYLISISVFLLASYAMFFIGSLETITIATMEDHFFEYLTAILFLGASVLFLLVSLKNRKSYFFGVLAFIFFLGFGEEISWGQRVFGWSTPERMKSINVQGEMNIHNLEIFHEFSFEKQDKTGLAKLLTMSVMYKLFCLAFGVILPLATMFSKHIRRLAEKMRLPVPALVLGLFFILNWLVSFSLKPLFPWDYGHPIVEVRECCSAFIFFVISFSFYQKTIQSSRSKSGNSATNFN